MATKLNSSARPIAHTEVWKRRRAKTRHAMSGLNQADRRPLAFQRDWGPLATREGPQC